jgi:hypothetical protein
MSNPPDDPVERSILMQLGQLAQGANPWGQRPSDADRIRAGQEYLAVKERLAARGIEAELRDQNRKKLEHDMALEGQRAANEEHRLALEAQNRARELDIEEEKVQVAKAEVVIRAIEAASRNPDISELISVARVMSERLLGTTVGLPALEDKQKR